GALRAEAANVLDRLDAALGDEWRDLLRLWRKAREGVGMHLERLQIPGVDAQQIRLAERRRLELALLVNFAEHRHLQLAGERSELLEQRGRRGCGDEQHRVGAKSARLIDLEDADDEVLAQDRQRDCRAGGAQILERTAEMNAVRQDRKTGRAAALESLAELRGIELRI